MSAWFARLSLFLENKLVGRDSPFVMSSEVETPLIVNSKRVRLFLGDLWREQPEQPAFLRRKIDIDQRDASL